MVEANKVKAIIKKNNKVKSIQKYIDTLIGYKEDAQANYDEGIVVTREEWKAILIEENNWLGDNWDYIYKEGTYTTMGWNTKEDYIVWRDEANESKIDFKIDFVKMNLRRIKELDKRIANEQVKLEKAKAL